MARHEAQVAHRTGSTLLAGELTLSAVCCLAVTIVWAATGGPFWPMWVWTGLGLPIALQVALAAGLGAAPGAEAEAGHPGLRSPQSSPAIW